MTYTESKRLTAETSYDEAWIFSISGMSCFSCVRKIESVVHKMPGVSKVDIDLGRNEALVLFNSLAVRKNDIGSAIEEEGYKVTRTYKPENSRNRDRQKNAVFLSSPFPYIKGLFAAFGIIGFYLGLLTLTSDWYYARVQFEEFRIWIVLLAVGLGIQVFLYSILRLHIRRAQIKGAGKSLAASGGLSTAGMAACCAHYLVTVLPVLGVPFVSTAIASLVRYQPLFFFIGVLSNVLGILFMLNLMRKNKLFSKPGFLNTIGQNSGSI